MSASTTVLALLGYEVISLVVAALVAMIHRPAAREGLPTAALGLAWPVYLAWLNWVVVSGYDPRTLWPLTHPGSHPPLDSAAARAAMVGALTSEPDEVLSLSVTERAADEVERLDRLAAETRNTVHATPTEFPELRRTGMAVAHALETCATSMRFEKGLPPPGGAPTTLPEPTRPRLADPRECLAPREHENFVSVREFGREYPMLRHRGCGCPL